MEKKNLKGMTKEELYSFFEEIGEKSFRGLQMTKHMYQRGISDFDEMTDFGKKLRDKLKNIAYIEDIKTLRHLISSQKDTEKFLFGLSDGNCLESVIMSYEDHIGPSRLTACISTQVGCLMGCSFCATGKSGFIRNLTAGEIADQIIQMQKIIAPSERRIANVVMMGMGEPMLNYDNVMKAVDIINCAEGIAIGMRHIAISTCGIIPGIKKLAKEGIQVKLAVSLHSPFNEIRSKIMPINKKYPLPELMKALKEYQEITGRRITFEYAMIDGVNDDINSAEELARILEGFTALINLIPLNNVTEYGKKRSTDEKIEKFKSFMENKGIRTTIRKERGTDINAACGQLRKKVLEEQENEHR